MTETFLQQALRRADDAAFLRSTGIVPIEDDNELKEEEK